MPGKPESDPRAHCSILKPFTTAHPALFKEALDSPTSTPTAQHATALTFSTAAKMATAGPAPMMARSTPTGHHTPIALAQPAGCPHSGSPSETADCHQLLPLTCSTAAGMATAGPTPMIAGSTPTAEKLLKMPSTGRPLLSASRRVMSSTAAAPSVTCAWQTACLDSTGLQCHADDTCLILPDGLLTHAL
jgi:hypothetical protein